MRASGLLNYRSHFPTKVKDPSEGGGGGGVGGYNLYLQEVACIMYFILKNPACVCIFMYPWHVRDYITPWLLFAMDFNLCLTRPLRLGAAPPSQLVTRTFAEWGRWAQKVFTL